jgi:hypothetical protein
MLAPSLFKKSQCVLASVQNVLLVHRAWTDGSCWNQVISNLSADGYNVTAVQLPFTALADDVAVVSREPCRGKMERPC